MGFGVFKGLNDSETGNVKGSDSGDPRLIYILLPAKNRICIDATTPKCTQNEKLIRLMDLHQTPLISNPILHENRLESCCRVAEYIIGRIMQRWLVGGGV
jgi:hypothetical protein